MLSLVTEPVAGYTSLKQVAVVAALTTCASLAAVASASSEQNESAAVFDQWDAFFEETSCWIATLPLMKDGSSPEEVALYVAFHMQLPIPEISFQTEERFVGDFIRVKVGDQSYAFEIDADTAFAPVESELMILKFLLSGHDMAVTYQLEELAEVSRKTTARGFRDAYNFLSRNCEFKFVPDLSETMGVEPTYPTVKRMSSGRLSLPQPFQITRPRKERPQFPSVAPVAQKSQGLQ